MPHTFFLLSSLAPAQTQKTEFELVSEQMIAQLLYFLPLLFNPPPTVGEHVAPISSRGTTP